MAIPKLFCLPKSGGGQLKFLLQPEIMKFAMAAAIASEFQSHLLQNESQVEDWFVLAL